MGIVIVSSNLTHKKRDLLKISLQSVTMINFLSIIAKILLHSTFDHNMFDLMRGPELSMIKPEQSEGQREGNNRLDHSI